MSDTKLLTGRDLGKAICSHFGLSADRVQHDYRIKTELDGLASINLTISLTPDDLAGIARAAAGDEPQAAAQELKLKVDVGEAAETLRRYGVGVGRSEIAALTEEVRQLRKELNARLYEVAKNTKRSADIAEDVGSPSIINSVEVRPAGGGSAGSTSGCHAGPRSGDFFDKHGIKNVYLGGQD